MAIGAFNGAIKLGVLNATLLCQYQSNKVTDTWLIHLPIANTATMGNVVIYG